MANLVPVPYEEYTKLVKDSADKENAVALLNATFQDTDCQILAIKTVLEDEDATTPSAP